MRLGDGQRALFRKEAKGAAGLMLPGKDEAQARWLLVLAAIYDGATRAQAAVVADVTVQTVREWADRAGVGGEVQ